MLKSKPIYIIPPRYKKATHLNIEQIKRQHTPKHEPFITDEFVQIIDRSCSGKFSRFVKKR